MMPTANQLNVNKGSAEEANKVRICVIGAGPAGLMTLRALQSLDVNKFDVTCYERYAEVGGMWNFRYYGNFLIFFVFTVWFSIALTE